MKKIKRKWLKAILILPFNVIVVIPSMILALLQISGDKRGKPSLLSLLLALFFFFTGSFLALWTMKLFNDLGKGTAAPWDPPENLVSSGPYRYVRNPMITSVLFMLTGECIFFSSIALAIYTLLFFLINCLYFHFVEEKELERRFGEDYIQYKKSTPMWLPKIR